MSPAPGRCDAVLGGDVATRHAVLVGLSLRHGNAILVGIDDPALPGGLRRNLEFPLRARGVAALERGRQVDEVLALTGLERGATARTMQGSPALQARMVVARAALAGRDLVLLEGFPGRLDPQAIREFATMLRLLARMRAIAIVVATGEREAALLAGERIGLLAGTRVVQFDDARRLFSRPASAEVASLLFEANLLTGRIEADLEDAPECRVRLATGETMPASMAEAAGSDAWQGGSLCRVAVRQDQIAFAATDAGSMGGDALRATLVEAQDFGDHLRLRFRLADGTAILLRRPAGSIGTASLAQAREPGGSALAWRSSQAIAFPVEDA